MIEVVDLKEIRYESHDLADLQSLLKQLIGQAFRFFRVSYGDELRLHLGDLLTHPNPKLAKRPRGSYVVGARASSWILDSSPLSALLLSDSLTAPGREGSINRVDIKQVEAGGYIVPGSIVRNATADQSANGFSLQITFTDGSRAMILPDPAMYEHVPEGETPSQGEAGTDMEISDWEILTPRSRILRVGPGNRWCYLDSEKRKGE
jgi:hypothetical protein